MQALTAACPSNADRVTAHDTMAGIRWFHSITLGDGSITPGSKTAQTLRAEADIIFQTPVAGRTVLDIGAWDGYFSFEAERLGASRVVASDHFVWRKGGDAGFNFAHRSRGSRVEALNVDIFDLDPDKHGTFDVVLFLGVLYHLKNPLEGLEHAAAMTRDVLVVQTQQCEKPDKTPLMQYLRPGELYGDVTNFWAPNAACLEAMLIDVGFARIETRENPAGVWHKPRSYFRRSRRMVGRIFAHAHRSREPGRRASH